MYLLLALGCKSNRLQAVKLALGPVRFDAKTDRSVLASMTIAKFELESWVYEVPNVLDLDPVAVSARISQRPATIAGKWIRPNEILSSLINAL